MLTSVKSAEAGTTRVHAVCLALTTARGLYSAYFRRGLGLHWKSCSAIHDIHYWPVCLRDYMCGCSFANPRTQNKVFTQQKKVHMNKIIPAKSIATVRSCSDVKVRGSAKA
jgi:hypothetical protein